ncbi:unnamed protein product [Vitrella brassicaformis CCMP3155]|uniref:tRNA (guanine(37)-N1)-methyltransferase n=1 Tax=Vitrella brassicaformis (strain CCMP3155) TaxID=1169540 RepID=A0A0G4FZC4_VITBC|nr:unnamed protein product [Vitrella brassicaformis CCMP3155]|eukprot:CEM20974.1 unnamed protein product [Vitrella brassicaformis CCMP3155]
MATDGDVEKPARLDRTMFDSTLPLTALRVPAQCCNAIMKNPTMKNVLLRRPKLRSVVEDAQDMTKRLVLLAENVTSDLSELPDNAVSFLASQVCPQAASGEVDDKRAELRQIAVEYGLKLTYADLSTEEVFRRVLPACGEDPPTAFETIGHIAHLNLREQWLPYKHIIGQVILDKNPGLRTVCNKVCTLANTFRTPELELLAGQEDFVATVRESGLAFEVDYANVYWNSRLSNERSRLADLIPREDTVCDMFAGVGAFAMYLGRKGCRVLANDLNPVGAKLITTNAQRNRVSANVTSFNMDARAFVRHCAREEGLGLFDASSRPLRLHFVMNLPELAIDFLDVFRGIYRVATGRDAPSDPGSPSAGLPRLSVHCYCFAKTDPPEDEIHPRVEAALGMVPPETRLTEVRDVAPRKRMYCVEFDVPPEVAWAEHPAESRTDGEGKGDGGEGQTEAGPGVEGEGEPVLKKARRD